MAREVFLGGESVASPRGWLRDDTDEGALMACEKLEACSEFLAFYRKVGRNDVAASYLDSYCHHENHRNCKRRECFDADIQPADDLTPNGFRSMLVRYFK